MKTLIHYLRATFRAARFADVSDYYSNTRKEALASLLVVLASFLIKSHLFAQHILILAPRTQDVPYALVYLGAASATFIVAFPKFLLFFYLVWQFCAFFKQTDRYYAFVAANNWFYVIFTMIFVFGQWLDGYIIRNQIRIEHPEVFPMFTVFYLTCVVNYLAWNVLRLRQELAWIVPVMFLFVHALVKIVSGKNGMFFVF